MTRKLYKLEGFIMVGYKVGSQIWYDVTRQRLVEISKELQKPDLVQEKRDSLYFEQLYLADSLLTYADDELMRNPLE
jgi:hypothetical protein